VVSPATFETRDAVTDNVYLSNRESGPEIFHIPIQIRIKV